MLRLGDNVGLSDCTIFGHDGIVHVINARDGTKLDSVGGVDIRANSFVGHGAIVMPRVTIGPDSVVAAGAVVLRDVPPGMVVGVISQGYLYDGNAGEKYQRALRRVPMD
jgi:acetyltransferase-like isoleucine patch superfamily enzyme